MEESSFRASSFVNSSLDSWNQTENSTSIFTDDLYLPDEVFVLNQPLQCLIIVSIITVALSLNILVINNICRSELKMSSVNFILIANLCLTDFLGALLVLPMPLIATIRGRWSFGNVVCTANSIINVTLWIQHIANFVMLKIDRVLASCLPIGRYPLIPLNGVLIIMGVVWLVSLFTAGLVTSLFKASYEPAVVLCIPNLPVAFFITMFSTYCLALLAMVVGYILVIICLKKKAARINGRNGMKVVDYHGLERAALTSFLITISHFLLYVPTMFVIGLHGWFLHPVAILICDLVVYSEFLVHPTVLLATSTKLRGEIAYSIKIFAQESCPWLEFLQAKAKGVFCCVGKHKVVIKSKWSATNKADKKKMYLPKTKDVDEVAVCKAQQSDGIKNNEESNVANAERWEEASQCTDLYIMSDNLNHELDSSTIVPGTTKVVQVSPIIKQESDDDDGIVIVEIVKENT